MLRQINNFSKNRDGAIAIFVAISLTVLLTVTAMAFEAAQYNKAKVQFVNAMDQALLAGAVAEPLMRGNEAAWWGYTRRHFYEQLRNMGVPYEMRHSPRITKLPNNTYTMRSYIRIYPTLSSLLPGRGRGLAHTAEVSWDPSIKTEVVAMMDVSGTMCATYERPVDPNQPVSFRPDANCTKMRQAKEAMKNILNVGVATSDNRVPMYAVGIVPYSFKIALPNPQNVPTELIDVERNANFGDNYYTNLADAQGSGPPLPRALGLQPISTEAEKVQFLEKVEGLTTPDNQEFNRPFMKRSPLGLLFSAYMLDPSYAQSLYGGARPADFGTPKTRKVVIMMSDSANLGCCFTNWPQGTFDNNYLYSYKADHEALIGTEGRPSICEAMKEQGIEIFTVLLDVDPRDAVAGNEIRDAYKQCASGPEHFFEVKRNDEEYLRRIYNIIGTSIRNLRLSK